MGWQRKKIHQPISDHLDDVLDLSYSKSQQLLSSSRDKTVRLWDMECKIYLKLFAHNDYVTCIQFNPVDDDYFISGRLTLRFTYGIYWIGKLYIGLICMKWSLLFATHMMAWARFVAFADCNSSFTLSFMSSFICRNLTLYNTDTCALFLSLSPLAGWKNLSSPRSMIFDKVKTQILTDSSLKEYEEDGSQSNTSIASSGKTTPLNRPPKDFMCPITSQLLIDPTTLETGQTYERRAIQEWLKRGNTTCPIIRQPLPATLLPKTNYILKRLITS